MPENKLGPHKQADRHSQEWAPACTWGSKRFIRFCYIRVCSTESRNLEIWLSGATRCGAYAIWIRPLRRRRCLDERLAGTLERNDIGQLVRWSERYGEDLPNCGR